MHNVFFLAAILVDVPSIAIIQPSAIVPRKKRDPAAYSTVRPSLEYIPSKKCLASLTNCVCLTLFHDSSLDAQRVIHIQPPRNDVKATTFSFHSEKNILVLGVPSVYFDFERRIPAHINIASVPQNALSENVDEPVQTRFVYPHMRNCQIQTMKFFPDASRLIVTYSSESDGSWCTLFTLPQLLDDEGTIFL